jgi:hypothetical protein
MARSVEQILAEVTLYSDQQDYIIVQLPTMAIMAAAGIIAEIGEPFCALIVDKDEVSVVVPADSWGDFSKRLPGHKTADKPYRLITFDTPLEMTLVGFMARISQVLAEANVSILPLAAFSRDHVLVPAEQFDIALTALEQLKSKL